VLMVTQDSIAILQINVLLAPLESLVRTTVQQKASIQPAVALVLMDTQETIVRLDVYMELVVCPV